MKKKWDIAWAKLSRGTQDRYLTILWRDGYTEQAIADFFKGATKGRIVRRRQTGLHLATEGRGKVKKVVEYDRFVDLLDIDKMDDIVEQSGGNVVCIAPVEALPPEPAEPLSESSEESFEQPAAPEVRPPVPESNVVRDVVHPDPERPDDGQRTASRHKPKYQITTDWRVQCVHRDEHNLQCSYVKEPRSEYCKLHK
jgi:hypothetical protein